MANSRPEDNAILRATALVALGLAALFTGPGWLLVLLPVAMLIWYGVSPLWRQRH